MWTELKMVNRTQNIIRLSLINTASTNGSF
ncbi:hypothetical protein EG68_03872 [Paragonimus skrjabini miyazakii]|uniref:Uncharacterized protein n=1 Tax=Paragonimus skrjabini miyazakii TaxID=59628 RepID=A0A8S9YV55_9TREM|nr:hypothetical protein EG68_03872 [Paragonimus skrjabini miyazakii]